MKKSTIKKIAIVTFKSIRVVAWAVVFVAATLGIIFFFGEPAESLGAGTEFFLAMIYKTLLGIGCFLITAGAGWVASKITQLFKECGIK